MYSIKRSALPWYKMNIPLSFALALGIFHAVQAICCPWTECKTKHPTQFKTSDFSKHSRPIRRGKFTSCDVYQRNSVWQAESMTCMFNTFAFSVARTFQTACTVSMWTLLFEWNNTWEDGEWFLLWLLAVFGWDTETEENWLGGTMLAGKHSNWAFTGVDKRGNWLTYENYRRPSSPVDYNTICSH